MQNDHLQNNVGPEDRIAAKLTELLSSHADDLLHYMEPVISAPLLWQSDLPIEDQREGRELMLLSIRLHNALTPVEPSAVFIEQLRNDLTGNQPETLMIRWRKLPARYRLAAKLSGATLTLGFMFLAIRRRWAAVRGTGGQRQEAPDSGLINSMS